METVGNSAGIVQVTHIFFVSSSDKGDYFWKDVVFHLGSVKRRHCLHTDWPGPPH